MEEIELIVNRERISLQVSPEETLLDLLRKRLGLTGARNGCDGEGTCGVCTVLLNGKPVRSCRKKAKEVVDHSILTIEGLTTLEGRLHPVQEAFVRHGAIQCGFCTPAMILSAVALLQRSLNPSREEMKQALRHVLCRCGTYPTVFRAIEEAAAVMRGEKTPTSIGEGVAVGTPLPKVDSIPKVTAQLRYGDDLTPSGVLYGKVLWSAHPHARVLSIGTSKAKTMPGVAAVLTAKDVPGQNRYGPMIRDAQVLAEGIVRYIGEPVAVVFAETEEQAAAARDAIRVEYQPLPGVFAPQEALNPEGPKIHPQGNILHQTGVHKGDLETGLAHAAVIVEDTYTTPFVEHAYLQPESGLAEPSPDGGVKVMMDTQYPFGDARQLADILGLPLEKVRVVQLPSGGAFGAKNDMTVQPLLALGALATGRPVKITLTRAESLRHHVKKHRFVMRYKVGATQEAALTALQAQILMDTGAYASWGIEVAEQSTVFATGPYQIPNIEIDHTTLYTNNPPCGAMRGFGINQVAFAMERSVDRIARKLGIDPFAIRRLNAMRPGSITSTGQVLGRSVGYVETLDKVEAALKALPPREIDGRRVGVGVAGCFKNVGLGLGADDVAESTVELLPDGQVGLRVGASELGQGTVTAMAQIAAQTLGVPFSHIQVRHGDTGGEGPDSGPTCASRTTYLAGNATIAAALSLQAKVIALAAEVNSLPPERLELAEGGIRHRETQQEVLPLAELAELAADRGVEMIAKGRFQAPTTFPVEGKPAQDQVYKNYATFGFGTQAAVVAVEPQTGTTKVLTIIACHDVGKAINPLNVHTQIEGSCLMGLGYALSEEFVMQEGWNLTDTLGKCRIPRVTEAPEIVTMIVEVEEPEGPYGAKGVAEIASLPTAPAIINAICDAVGVRITDLPADKKRILQALSAIGRGPT